MFWALISPFRHTSQPPRLSPTSPLRIFFETHGARVARHPVLSIVLSVTLAVVFSYPFLFLVSRTTTDPVLTNHAWSSARPFVFPGAVPDIGIKQAWVHGSYMRALTPEVLQEGLRIQQQLLGPEVSCATHADASYVEPRPSVLRNGNASKLDMFLHSPLLYWNCSLEAVQKDTHIVDTVNRNTLLHSSANVTLRWRSVFAGKQFKDHQLAAADSLIISLFYARDSPAGKLWDERAAKLAQEAKEHGRYTVSFGEEMRSTLYEIRYQPISTMDIMMLAGCYVFAAAYLAVSLRRLRAVKSRFGLVLTVITQIGISIMSSFTILGVFQIPVFHIPREVFPFVVIVIGLENMFRLINAVLATPAEQPTTVRVATALGEVGFLSFVAVAFDIVILSLIGSLSVPAVREFCVFAAVALAMDFVLHLTYFLAVLSVDVRRMELQDSLDKLSLSNAEEYNLDDPLKKSADITAVFDFLFKGGSPLSTRVAGSAIMICFAVALNMHFLENQSPFDTTRAIMMLAREPRRMWKRSPALASSIADINPARSPLTWLRIQEHTTGAEIINAVKPGASRLVARVYDPLYVVLTGSDRTRSPWNALQNLDTDILKGHMQAFVLTVVVTVAGVTLLMNYLLMKNIVEDVEVVKREEPLASAQTLYEGHSLDVAMLAASPKGVLVSVGLDRRIVVWKLSGNRQPPTKDVIRPTCAEHVLWPVIALTLDAKGEWLAIAPKSGMISFYQVKEAAFYRSLAVELHGQPPSAFFFAPPLANEPNAGPRLIVLLKNGWLSEVYVKTREIIRHKIGGPIVVSSAHAIVMPNLPLRIVTACQQGRLFVTSKVSGSGEWFTDQLSAVAPPVMSPIMHSAEPCTILPLSALGMVVSSRSCNVDLIDVITGSIIRSFQTGQFRPSTLRALHAKRRTCLYCGCPSVLSFSIAYTERDSGMFMMHTFSSSRGRMRDICLRGERDRRERKCTGFESVIETTHWLEHVEAWEPTNLNMVAGIRRRELSSEYQSSTDDYETPCQGSSLRRRKKMDKKPCLDDEDEWEAWTMDANGVVNTYPLTGKGENGESHDGLLVSRAGPVTQLGHRSVAVGFGNTVKVLLVGNERFEDEESLDPFRTPARRRMNHRR